jgi:hypothetical protein
MLLNLIGYESTHIVAKVMYRVMQPVTTMLI